MTPLDRWAMSAQDIRLVGPECDLDDLFLFEQKRRVQRDRTVSLNGIVYEVDASLVGETVTLRFDPARRGRPVDVYFKGRKVEQAKRVDLYANCFVKRDHTTKALQPDQQARRSARGPVTCATSRPERRTDMYRQHFGLNQHPFTKEVDPEDLFPAAAAKELEVRLAHLLEMRGIGLVTGDSRQRQDLRRPQGPRRSSTPRSTASSTSASPRATSWTSTRPSPGRWVCPSSASRAALFRQIRTRSHPPRRRGPMPAHPRRRRGPSPAPRRPRRPAPPHQLRDGRREPALPAPARQPELRRRLAMAVHEALSQRIVVRLPPPRARPATRSPPTSPTCSGSPAPSSPLFEPAAHEALFQASSGLPRKINLLAHHALHRRRARPRQDRHRRARPGRSSRGRVDATPTLALLRRVLALY